MQDRLTVVSLGRHTRLGDVLDHALEGRPFCAVTADELLNADLTGQRILFAVSLDEYGMQPDASAFLRHLRKHPQALNGSTGALLLDGESELYTKDAARTLVLDANRAGCRFIPRALVEATGSLRNFDILSDLRGVNRYAAYNEAARTLVTRLLDDAPSRVKRPNILL